MYLWLLLGLKQRTSYK